MDNMMLLKLSNILLCMILPVYRGFLVACRVVQLVILQEF
jgi:hypothetical protein